MGGHHRSTSPVAVLYVDDDPGLLDLGADLLERADDDLAVHTEPTASDGLDYLDDATVDCVVSDYNMPGMDGLAFLAAVRDDHTDLPFVLFTGRGSEEIASEAISAGVTDYLQKGGGTDQYTVLANRVRNAVDQARSRRALEAREESLRRAQRVADLGNWDWDVETDALFWSDQIYRIFGVAPADFDATYGAFLSFVHPEDRDRVEAAVAAALADEAPYDVQHRIVTATGEERVVHERAEVRRVDGKPVEMNGTVQDVTDRVSNRLERAALRVALDEVDRAVFWTDSAGTIRAVNARFETLTGYTRAEAVGTTPQQLQGTASGEGEAAYWAAIQRGESWEGRVVTEDRSGARSVVERTVTPVLADGAVERVVCVDRPVADDG